MKTLAIFVMLLTITVTKKMEESRPNLMGTEGSGGLQLPTQLLASLQERKPRIQGTKSWGFFVISFILD